MRMTIATIVLALGMAATAAQPTSDATGGGSGAGSFALGLQIGASDGGNFSGITARVGREKTIEGVLAIDHKDWIVNGNFLVHSHNLFHQAPIQAIKLYGGFGAGAWTGGDGGFWVQVPLGVDFDFPIPVEASLYLAPGINIVPETDANWHFGLGIRYWFQ